MYYNAYYITSRDKIARYYKNGMNNTCCRIVSKLWKIQLSKENLIKKRDKTNTDYRFLKFSFPFRQISRRFHRSFDSRTRAGLHLLISLLIPFKKILLQLFFFFTLYHYYFIFSAWLIWRIVIIFKINNNQDSKDYKSNDNWEEEGTS